MDKNFTFVAVFSQSVSQSVSQLDESDEVAMSIGLFFCLKPKKLKIIDKSEAFVLSCLVLPCFSWSQHSPTSMCAKNTVSLCFSIKGKSFTSKSLLYKDE